MFRAINARVQAELIAQTGKVVHIQTEVKPGTQLVDKCDVFGDTGSQHEWGVTSPIDTVETCCKCHVHRPCSPQIA